MKIIRHKKRIIKNWFQQNDLCIEVVNVNSYFIVSDNYATELGMCHRLFSNTN